MMCELMEDIGKLVRGRQQWGEGTRKIREERYLQYWRIEGSRRLGKMPKPAGRYWEDETVCGAGTNHWECQGGMQQWQEVPRKMEWHGQGKYTFMNANGLPFEYSKVLAELINTTATILHREIEDVYLENECSVA